MRQLPLTDPGRPDVRSPGRFLRRVALLQWWQLAAGSAFGVVWMVGQALIPYVLGRAIDAGVAGADTAALLRWAGALLAVGAVQAGAGVIRHRFAVFNWLVSAYRVQQWIVRQSVRLGGALPQRIPTGEVVSIGATDIMQIGAAMEIQARAVGAIASFAVVAVIMLTSSTTLGLVVLIGVPALTLLIGPILRPLQRRQAAQRGAVGELTTLGSDTVAGLRVLRGIGGEETFVERYRRESQRVRRAGVEVARVESVLDAVQVLLPGIFVVAVTWLGARFAIAGRISAGELVAFYGYAAFLMTPLRTATEAADKISRALVGARRAIRVLALDPVLADANAQPAAATAVPTLVDHSSGLTIRPGELLAVVSGLPEESSGLADRLGRYVDADVTLDGQPLRDLPIEEVRRRILVSDKDPRLFTGTLREELDPLGRHEDPAIDRALHAADARDVLDGLADGLDAAIEERGRSLSGGQRQRLVLARALLAGANVLVLDEPTSAVDAHTEARIADRLRAARTGASTVVMTTSPLVLDRVDRVVLLHRGRVVADGTHHALLRRSAAYRAVVTRSDLAPQFAAADAADAADRVEMKEGA